jgi:hypothetical protein
MFFSFFFVNKKVKRKEVDKIPSFCSFALMQKNEPACRQEDQAGSMVDISD